MGVEEAGCSPTRAYTPGKRTTTLTLSNGGKEQPKISLHLAIVTQDEMGYSLTIQPILESSNTLFSKAVLTKTDYTAPRTK